MIKEEIKNYGLFRAVKYVWQRAVRGYDEKIFWGFGGYFSTFAEPLKKFCEKELKH